MLTTRARRTPWNWLTGLAIGMAMLILLPDTAHAACPPGASRDEWVQGGSLCLAIKTFGTDTAGKAPVLIIMVHGEISTGGPADYHTGYMQSLARPGVIAVALIRPGYPDGTGRRSQGSDHGRYDSYTSTNIAAIAGAINALKRHHHARKIIYIGHSGGAAIGGVILGQHPALIQGAVLAACPCNVPRWRAERRGDAWPRSLSPHSFVGSVARSTRIIAITGTADSTTPQALAEDYTASLMKRGIPARFQPVSGAGHGFSGLSSTVTAAVHTLM